MSALLLKTHTSSGGAEAKRLDLIMAANVQTSLATKVQELSGEFRKKQTAYLRRAFLLPSSSTPGTDSAKTELKGHEGRAQDHLSFSTSKDPLASLYDDEQYVRFALLPPSPLTPRPQSQSIQTQQATLRGPDLAQRDSEISSIAQSITDLADLFKDLSSLVIDQGTLLDRVDWNVEQMGVEVKGAVEELKVATTCVLSLPLSW